MDAGFADGGLDPERYPIFEKSESVLTNRNGGNINLRVSKAHADTSVAERKENE